MAMKATIWTLVALALLATGAFAAKNDGCKSTLTMDHVWVAMGKGVLIANDVFARKGDICCDANTSHEFEVTFKIGKEVRKFLIARP